jgi:hypothetical protein
MKDSRDNPVKGIRVQWNTRYLVQKAARELVSIVCAQATHSFTQLRRFYSIAGITFTFLTA